MKKITALLLALVMVFGMVACGGGTAEESATPSTAPDASGEDVGGEEAGGEDTPEAASSIKVGLICIGDANDQGYTYNFIRATELVTENMAAEGVAVEWVIKFNVSEGGTEPQDAAIELAEEGCELIIANSFGFEPTILNITADYPDIEFVCCTNLGSTFDDQANTHNAFADIYEGRYLAGVVSGLKLQQLIDSGEITEEEAVIGYVAAFPFSEVISGYTSFYLGARSVCPTATMKVQYVSTWSDPTQEANAAQALIDQGAVLISQHSDTTTPATTAQSNGVYHTGYNNDMIPVAPDASLTACTINWNVYFEFIIHAILNGEEIPQDWTAGINEGAVSLTTINETIAAPGTMEKVEEVKAGLADGTIEVFAGPWTGTGTAYGADAPDTMTMAEGEFYSESDVENGGTSAPTFYWVIEGIETLN